MPTLREYRNALSRKLGGFITGKVAIDPDPTDALAMRSIITESLVDPERQADSFKGAYAWIGEFCNQRRVRGQGFTTMSYVVYEPPSDGSTYTITFYGFGTTKVLAGKTPNDQIVDAIKLIDADYFSTVNVYGDGSRKIIQLPAEPIDVSLSNGELISQTGLARIETTSGFTKPLPAGTTFDIHTKLPAKDSDEFVGLDTHINNALRKMWFQDLFPVTSNAQGIYDKRDIPGFFHPDQIQALMGPADWLYTATFTPPTTGRFYLQFETIYATITTEYINVADIQFGTEIADAVTTAFNAAGYSVPYTMTSLEYGPWTVIFQTRTQYSGDVVKASDGIITHDRQMLSQPSRVSGGYQFVYSAASPYLVAPMFSPGASFYIYGLLPGNSWIAPQDSYGIPGTNWGHSTEGLVNDYDQAVPSLDEVLALSYYEATKHLATIGPGAETAYWKEEAQRAGIVAAHIKMYDLPFDRMPTGRRIRYGGKIGYLWG